MLLISLCLIPATALLLTEAWFVRGETEKSIRIGESEVDAKDIVAFSRKVLPARPNPYIRLIQKQNDISAIAAFDGSIFAATSAGLVKVANDGAFIRRFNVPDGLPESELTALAAFGSVLFIGTKSNGLVTFDGERFTSIYLEKKDAQNITALFAGSQTLLVATLQGGLLEFDGERFTEIRFDDKPILHAIAVAVDASRTFVGTFSEGLFVRDGKQTWRRFTTADGLLSNRVVGIASSGNDVFVATDLGLSRVSGSELSGETRPVFTKLLSATAVTGVVAFDERIFVSRSNGDIFEVDAAKPANAPDELMSGLTNGRFAEIDGRVFLFGNGGLASVGRASGETILKRFSDQSDVKGLSENTVSAVAADAAGRLWLGTFRGGIDVFLNDGKPFAHFQTDELRAINFIGRAQNDDNDMLTGAAGGAFRSQSGEAPRPFARSKDLPQAVVTHFSAQRRGGETMSALSTSRGVTITTNESRREFSSLNGLPSNAVFGAAFDEKVIYVATMSGLAVIEDGRVRQVLTTSNSPLRNNWVTALFSANERIYGGTYGGGVFEITAGSEIVPLSPSGEKIQVNPNALFADGERIYAGTLDGLVVFDLEKREWSKLSAELPSATVLAVGDGGESVLLGTTAGAVVIDRRFWENN